MLTVPPRKCTECLAYGTKREAKFIASDSCGLEWFDCGEHPLTNRSRNITQTPIAEWFESHKLLEEPT